MDNMTRGINSMEDYWQQTQQEEFPARYEIVKKRALISHKDTSKKMKIEQKKLKERIMQQNQGDNDDKKENTKSKSKKSRKKKSSSSSSSSQISRNINIERNRNINDDSKTQRKSTGTFDDISNSPGAVTHSILTPPIFPQQSHSSHYLPPPPSSHYRPPPQPQSSHYHPQPQTRDPNVSQRRKAQIKR